MQPSLLRARLPLFLAVFIDIFSFGLMYPLIIGMFHTGWVAQAYSSASRDAFLSLAFSLFPIGMFFGASLLGDLSDALGRRRTLMICMAGLAGGYGLMWASVELHLVWLFLAGRLVSGLMAGTAPIAQAAMMDTAPADQRSEAMAQVTLVNTVGLVAGPAVGGVLGHWDFRLPLGLALTLCVVTLITLWSSTLAGDVAKRKFEFDWRQPFLLFMRIRLTPGLIAPVLAFFLFQFGFMVYYTFIMIEMQRSYGFSTAQIGLFSMVMGCGFVAGTSFGYKIAKKLLGADRRVATVGLAVCGVLVGMTALPMPASVQVVLTVLIATSNILAFVTLLAAIASAVEESEQGWALGVGNASVALSVFAAGLLSSLLSIIPSAAFEILGGLLILSAIVPTQRLTTANTKAVAAQ
jgi:DHA1 family tetracycline resistance protein-like MFS transporter